MFVPGEIHSVDDLLPARSLFGIIEAGDTAHPCILFRKFVGHHLDAVYGALQALHAGEVGVPVVVDVVFVFVRPRHSQQHKFLPCLRVGYPLAPEPADGNHHLQSVAGNVLFVACHPGILHDGIYYDVVAVYLFESDFPLVVAFFSVDGHHRIECRPVGKSQFTCVFDGFGQLVIAVEQQFAAHFSRGGQQEVGHTAQFCVPLRVAAVFFSRESLRTDVQPLVVSLIALVQLEDVEPYALLCFRVSFDLHVRLLPDFCPPLLMGCRQRFPSLLPGCFGFVHSALYQLLTVTLQRRHDGGVLDKSHLLAGLHVRSGAESCQFFFFYLDGADAYLLAVPEKTVRQCAADL